MPNTKSKLSLAIQQADTSASKQDHNQDSQLNNQHQYLHQHQHHHHHQQPLSSQHDTHEGHEYWNNNDSTPKNDII